MLDGEFARRGLAERAQRFDTCDVWWAPVATLAEVVTDPQAQAIGAFVTLRYLGAAAGAH